MQTIRRVVSVLIILLIFYFLITTLVANWQRIPFSKLRFGFAELAISFIWLFIYLLIFVLVWAKILRELGEDIRFSEAFWIITTSQLAKYVPGGIWYTLGRVYLCKTKKLNSGIVFLSVIIETCLLLLTSMIIFLIAIAFTQKAVSVNPLILILIVVVLLFMLHPYFLNRLTNFGLKVLKKPEIKLTIEYKKLLNLSVYFFGLWCAQIIGFYFLINAIMPISFGEIFNLGGAYTLSWMSGFIVLFAPGGLGVREGMMTLLLSPLLPTPLAIAISFISRVWITVFEVIVFFIGLLVKRKAEGKRRIG